MRPRALVCVTLAAAVAGLSGCNAHRSAAHTTPATSAAVLVRPTAADPSRPIPATAPAVAFTPAPATTAVLAPPATTSPAADPAAALAPYYATRASWKSCPADFAAVDFVTLTGYECATVPVPLDYRHPEGRRISVGIARLRASGSHRIGSLMINPGGPGASGLAYLTAARRALPAAVRDRFDIVGFDPRGVGVSAGLHCLPTARLDALVAAPPAPGTPAQVAGAVARSHALAAGCARTAAAELPFIGTVYAARDLDLIRSAVGDPRLTYLGKSYGTLLGAVYADQFPSKVRALVLDGALPPGIDPAVQAREQGEGFEANLRDFLADCVGHRGCPWSGSPAQARTGLDALLATIAAHPLPTGSSRRLHSGEAVGGLSAALYSTSAWSGLRGALALATRGDGSALLSLSDSLSGRHPGGYATLISAFPAVSCADVPVSYTPARTAALAQQWGKTSPLYGPVEAWALLTCDGWTRSMTTLPARVRAPGAPPIVVIGTTGDPATPYPWAVDLAGQLASGRLVTYVGDGHTVYGGGRSGCVDSAVNAYLIDLAVPRTGLRCT